MGVVPDGDDDAALCFVSITIDKIAIGDIFRITRRKYLIDSFKIKQKWYNE